VQHLHGVAERLMCQAELPGKNLAPLAVAA
jgi:hypothetical protein